MHKGLLVTALVATTLSLTACGTMGLPTVAPPSQTDNNLLSQIPSDSSSYYASNSPQHSAFGPPPVQDYEKATS